MIDANDCPFCHSKHSFTIERAADECDGGTGYHAQCSNCHACGPAGHRTVVDAIRAWNGKRAEPRNDGRQKRFKRGIRFAQITCDTDGILYGLTHDGRVYAMIDDTNDSPPEYWALCSDYFNNSPWDSG